MKLCRNSILLLLAHFQHGMGYSQVAGGGHRLKMRRVAEKLLDKQSTWNGPPIWREGKQLPTIGLQHVTKYYTRPRTSALVNMMTKLQIP
jgi:hypothetical protein